MKNSGTVFHCILVGAGCDDANPELVAEIEALGLGNKVTLLGERSDVPAIMRALDLKVLSSRIEGFPNVLAEAMASGTPCVSTNVGDAELILGELGWLVDKEDPVALSGAIGDALDEQRELPTEWRRRQQQCREHILDNFSLDRMADTYFDLWQNASRRNA